MANLLEMFPLVFNQQGWKDIIIRREYPAAPVHQKMSKFYSRNETFVNWQHGGDLTALSKAGFFNDDGQLVCFYCAGSIKDPKSVKDPWISHAAWFPKCEYLLKEKTHNFVKSIQSLVIEL
jgi:hypothetical protein